MSWKNFYYRDQFQSVKDVVSFFFFEEIMAYDMSSFYKLHENNYQAFPSSYDQKCTQAIEIVGFFSAMFLGEILVLFLFLKYR